MGAKRCYGPLMPTRQRTQRPPIDLAVELERAVERNEFGLEYQPIIDLGSGSIAAVEALLRWRHPLMGTIAPADYLPLAEETGLIVPIGERVLDAATRQLRTWHLGFARMQSLRVNVNISPGQLNHPDLLGHISTVLQRSDLDPASLTLELGQGCGEYPDAIAALADVGVGLALEDFGQGSSLDDVREMPLTIVKLHPSFATMAAGSDDDVAFAESLLSLCRARGLATIGKGVETREQARRLAVIGCDMAQGYLYSKPLGSEGIGTLLARGRVTAPNTLR
jgi:EAL domain-containing protein (putative c-di-GMP-specific phosphodiesterase class I)